MRRWIFHHGAGYLSWFYCTLWLYTSVHFVIMFEPFRRYLLCKYFMQIYAINFSDKDCFKSSTLYYLLVNKKIWQLRLYHVLVFIVFQKISVHPPVYITWLDWKLPEGKNGLSLPSGFLTQWLPVADQLVHLGKSCPVQ